MISCAISHAILMGAITFHIWLMCIKYDKIQRALSIPGIIFITSYIDVLVSLSFANTFRSKIRTEPLPVCQIILFWARNIIFYLFGGRGSKSYLLNIETLIQCFRQAFCEWKHFHLNVILTEFPSSVHWDIKSCFYSSKNLWNKPSESFIKTVYG